MSQQKKSRPSELSQTVELTPQLLPVAVNTTVVSGQHSTPSAKTENGRISTQKPMPTLSNPTLNVGEQETLAAGVLKSSLPTLLAAGLIKTARHQETGSILLVFSPDIWREDFTLK